MSDENNNWYDLKNEMTEILASRINEYRVMFEKEGMAIPTWLVSEAGSNDSDDLSEADIEYLNQQWIIILEKMRSAFEKILEGDESDPTVQGGLDLFAKYYLHLWD